METQVLFHSSQVASQLKNTLLENQLHVLRNKSIDDASWQTQHWLDDGPTFS